MCLSGVQDFTRITTATGLYSSKYCRFPRTNRLVNSVKKAVRHWNFSIVADLPKRLHKTTWYDSATCKTAAKAPQTFSNTTQQNPLSFLRFLSVHTPHAENSAKSQGSERSWDPFLILVLPLYCPVLKESKRNVKAPAAAVIRMSVAIRSCCNLSQYKASAKTKRVLQIPGI